MSNLREDDPRKKKPKTATELEEQRETRRRWAGTAFALLFVALSLTVLILVGRKQFWSFFAEFKYPIPFLVIFVLASLFPVSAFAYQLYRRDIVERRLGRDFWLLGIRFEGWARSDKPVGDRYRLESYTEAVRGLYEKAHSGWNYAVQTTIVVLLTILGLSLFFWPPATKVDVAATPSAGGEAATAAATPAAETAAAATPAAETAAGGRAATGRPNLLDANTLMAMCYGFVGSYIFAVQLVYRRYTTLDLQPTVYTNCALTMIGGIAFNYVAFTAIDAVSSKTGAAEGLEGAAVAIVAFCLGYFPLLAIRWFSRIAHSTLGLAQRQADALPLGLIDGISQLHETRLMDEGIDNIQNLASVSLDELLLNTRFSAQEVVEWVDQAILYVYLQASEIESFRRAGVRSFTDLQSQWAPYYPEIREQLDDIDRQLGSPRRGEELVEGGLSDPAKVQKAIADLKTERATLRATTGDDQSRKEKALQFQTLPERLDGLYCSTQQGPNVAHVRSYWQRARDDQALIEELIQQELRMTKEKTMRDRWLQVGKAPPEEREQVWSAWSTGGGGAGADAGWGGGPQHYAELIGQGYDLMKRGNLNAAISTLMQAPFIDDEKADADQLLAAAYARKAAQEENVEAARKLVREADEFAESAARKARRERDPIDAEAFRCISKAIDGNRLGEIGAVIEAWAHYQETWAETEQASLRAEIDNLPPELR